MNDKLYELLKQLPREKLIVLLWESLDLMQSYNGRSRTSCILETMGAENTLDTKWNLPSLKQIKINLQSPFV